MDQVAVDQRILQQWCHSVNVVLAHLADVLEHERERLKDAILHVHLRYTVLVHQGGEHREGAAGFSDNGDSDCRADPVLALLDSQVVEKSRENILRPDCFSDVAKGVNSSPSDAFLVRLEQVKEIETDAHPLTSADILRASVSNSAKGVNSSPSDAFLVRLEQVKEIETDAHPLTSADILRASVSNSANKVDAVLLDFFVSVF